MSIPELAFGAFGPLTEDPYLPTTRVNLQLVKIAKTNIGNGKTTKTLTLWDGVREIGMY